LSDESYIQLAIEIAKKGVGKVSPNPLVGAVIIKNDRIIGAGFHEKYGENHAEINAINSAKENLEGATLYINLEPCSHFGKTPPCVDQIIQKKIKRVVIGTLDMNPLTSGKGVKKLKAAGIEVKVGILEKECTSLNKAFFKYIIKKIPYISIKAAQTLDGKIADLNGGSKWISSASSRKYVHELRSKYDAVLVGSGTVKKDNPSLTVRLVEGRNPRRVILDTNLNLKTTYRIFSKNSDKNLIIITSVSSLGKNRKINKLRQLGAQIVFTKENENGQIDLKKAMEELAKIQISSILVEGGSEVITSLLEQKLYDDILVFISPKILGEGKPAIGSLGIKSIHKALQLNIERFEKIGDDLLIELKK
jgi:diaminohydroxyphosphoribosylaminopyrimidine deaminase / 5-amino-6-(5-phosphoribosylamino)uracil reductase